MDMPDSLTRAFERFKDGSQRLGRWVQHVVLMVLLFALYSVGFGLTRLLAVVFYRRYLTLFEGPTDAQSYWIEAKGYSSDPDNLRVQF